MDLVPIPGTLSIHCREPYIDTFILGQFSIDSPLNGMLLGVGRKPENSEKHIAKMTQREHTQKLYTYKSTQCCKNFKWVLLRQLEHRS